MLRVVSYVKRSKVFHESCSLARLESGWLSCSDVKRQGIRGLQSVLEVPLVQSIKICQNPDHS